MKMYKLIIYLVSPRISPATTTNFCKTCSNSVRICVGLRRNACNLKCLHLCHAKKGKYLRASSGSRVLITITTQPRYLYQSIKQTLSTTNPKTIIKFNFKHDKEFYVQLLIRNSTGLLITPFK